MKTNLHIANTSKAQNSFAPNTHFFQPKPAINKPVDVYEQEAGSITGMVMRMADLSAKQQFFAPVTVQRKCDHCEEEEEKKVQRKEGINQNTGVSSKTENYVNSLSGGQPLSSDERNFYGPKMAYDFSNVRLHTDSNANESAKSLDALAYTRGHHIVFGGNQYKPGSDKGKKLLAHELTHVVQQQSGVSAKNIQRACDSAKTTDPKQAKIQIFVVANDDGTNPVAAPNMISVDRIWEQCCLHMNVQDIKTIKDSSLKTLEIGGSAPSAQETKLISNKVSNAVNIFMVDTFSKNGNIDKNHSGGGRTASLGSSAPTSILVEGSVPSVVAHEIGHAFIGNTKHLPGTVMEGSGAYNTPNPTNVSQLVCTTVRKWSELNDIGSNSGDCCMQY